jgi:nicotinamidase-related amidase
MCVEATTRAAYDKGFQCIVPIETATTRDLTFKDFTINAKDVHYSTLSTLDGGYAKVINIDKILKAL